MKVIHYFNPETDYALATGSRLYNPPASIVTLKRRMQLFPATFAGCGDFIAVDSMEHVSAYSEHYDMARQKRIEIIEVGGIRDLIDGGGLSDFEIRPWGWNHTLLHRMRASGIPEEFLKSDREIDRLRELAHRRTSIEMQKQISRHLDGYEIPAVLECYTLESALSFLHRHGDAYFKMPWSSSGRGVIHASDFPTSRLCEWIAGGIKKQGSIMAEKAFDKSCDFATEWICRRGKTEYLGLSVFQTTGSGRYAGNIIETQQQLWKRIERLSNEWDIKIIEAQRNALDEIISPYYDGPVGIDMLATNDGRINPVVEINLRQTMGMAALFSQQESAN